MGYHEYRDYAEEMRFLRTGIHTRINEELRISSCFRKFTNPNFEMWAWETILWKGDRVERQCELTDDAEQAVSLHTKILKEYSEGRE